MTIRARIRLLQLVVGGAVLLMAAAVFLAARSVDDQREEVRWAHRQLDAITTLAVQANRHSASLAALLLIGDTARPGLDDARARIDAALDELEDATNHQVAAARQPDVRRRELAELGRIERIRGIYREIDASVKRLLALRDAGRPEAAVGVFLRDIENRLERELEILIVEAVAGERREVDEAEREAAATARRLAVLIAAATILALAVTAIAGRRLDRFIIRPVRELTTGAVALGHGDLSRRIAYAGRDELGLLAARFNDMAEQLKEQHGRLLAAHAELEEQVRRRTAELEAANRRLRDLDHLRVQFLADISHELRTPLTVLRGEAEVTLRARNAAAADYRETLARIVAQAADMGRLVDDLLFLARSETDTVRFDRANLDIVPLVAEAAREAEALGRPKGVMVSLDAPGSPVIVEGDRQRLKQTLAIVLDNAVKYSDRDGVVAIALAADGAEAEIVVRNCGVGVAPEDLPYVFERFYRGREHDPERSAGGSGLGLAIAKRIVDKHRGTIALASDGPCTEVRVRLPLAGSGAE